MYRAVIFDLGGVVYPPPFEAFDAYDVDAGLAPGTVRALIKTSSETGAWAALERGELGMDEFFRLLAAEATAEGFELDAIGVPTLLWQGVQDKMVPVAHARWLAERIPGVEAHISEEDGHLSISVGRLGEIYDWLAAGF